MKDELLKLSINELIQMLNDNLKKMETEVPFINIQNSYKEAKTQIA